MDSIALTHFLFIYQFISRCCDFSSYQNIVFVSDVGEAFSPEVRLTSNAPDCAGCSDSCSLLIQGKNAFGLEEACFVFLPAGGGHSLPFLGLD